MRTAQCAELCPNQSVSHDAAAWYQYMSHRFFCGLTMYSSSRRLPSMTSCHNAMSNKTLRLAFSCAISKTTGVVNFEAMDYEGCRRHMNSFNSSASSKWIGEAPCPWPSSLPFGIGDLNATPLSHVLHSVNEVVALEMQPDAPPLRHGRATPLCFLP